MSPLHLIGLYRNTSQLDEPVYESFAKLRPDNRATVIYWNDFGLARTKPDPELGVVPVFPTADPGRAASERRWIDARREPLARVISEVVDRKPDLVVINDLALRDKLTVSLACRRRGIRVAFRSDKNEISTAHQRAGAGLIERLVYRSAFNALCYVGELTRSYYRWRGAGLLFPYPSDTERFSVPTADARAEVRRELDIPDEATVLLSVIKFNAREGARETCEIYAQLLARRPQAYAVFVGAGPLNEEMRAIAEASGCADRFRFTGYAPYSTLHRYFWASDIFFQFALCEPWGVSVLDALAAGLGVVASQEVGSAVEVLAACEDLASFTVPFERADMAVSRLDELIGEGKISERFAAARRRVLDTYSVDATARRIEAFIEPVA
jgi:glycosyltransferase involved in cell wall biosynthesis